MVANGLAVCQGLNIFSCLQCSQLPYVGDSISQLPFIGEECKAQTGKGTCPVIKLVHSVAGILI